MPKVKLTIGRAFSYLVATEPHWPRIFSTIQNFLRYPLSCFSPKIPLKDHQKRFQFDFDQNLGHFEANLFDRAELEVYFWPWNAARRWWNPTFYPRPRCAPSFIKSGLIRILHQYFTYSLYVRAGETIMPPRVLASGPKPCRGKNKLRLEKEATTQVALTVVHELNSCLPCMW